MSTKNYLMITMVVFGLVALLQLLRLFRGWPVNVAGFEVPMLASMIAFAVAGALSVCAFVLLRKPSA